MTLVLRAGPDGGPEARPSPEAEIDALLAAAAAKTPPAELLVVLDGPDASVYRLEDAQVQLDGARVPLSTLPASGPPPSGTQLSDGDHVVTARLVYRGPPRGPYPWQEGPRWVLPTRVSLQASRGLRLAIHLSVQANERAPVGDRLMLHTDVEPQMLAAVDDTPLPPPPLPPLPTPPAEIPVATSVAALPAEAQPTPPPPLAKKKPKKKPTRARAVATVPAVAAPPKSPAPPPSGETLDEATARLRSALASPADAGQPTPAR